MLICWGRGWGGAGDGSSKHRGREKAGLRAKKGNGLAAHSAVGVLYHPHRTVRTLWVSNHLRLIVKASRLHSPTRATQLC